MLAPFRRYGWDVTNAPGKDDIVKKATNGYQMLNLGSTTGALEQPVTSWFDADERKDA